MRLLEFLLGPGTEPQGHPRSCTMVSFSACLVSLMGAWPAHVGQACLRFAVCVNGISPSSEPERETSSCSEPLWFPLEKEADAGVEPRSPTEGPFARVWAGFENTEAGGTLQDLVSVRFLCGDRKRICGCLGLEGPGTVRGLLRCRCLSRLETVLAWPVLPAARTDQALGSALCMVCELCLNKALVCVLVGCGVGAGWCGVGGGSIQTSRNQVLAGGHRHRHRVGARNLCSP